MHTHIHTQLYTSTHTYIHKQTHRSGETAMQTYTQDLQTCMHAQMYTNVHRLSQTHTEKTHRRNDADTHRTSHFFSNLFLLQFAFIFLQPESRAAAPCTLLDTTNFLKQLTSFATQHASLNSYYTEDPCKFALRTSGVWFNIFFMQRQVYNEGQVGDDDGQGGDDLNWEFGLCRSECCWGRQPRHWSWLE